jgi:hypothetical protein
LFNPCTKGSIDITVPSPPTAPEYMNIAVSFKGICSKRKVYANISAWVNVDEISTNTKLSFYADTKYKLTFTLLNNKTYKLKVVYGNKTYTANIPLNKSSFSFPNISGLNGSASYNSSTNTLTINASLILPNCLEAIELKKIKSHYILKIYSEIFYLIIYPI